MIAEGYPGNQVILQVEAASKESLPMSPPTLVPLSRRTEMRNSLILSILTFAIPFALLVSALLSINIFRPAHTLFCLLQARAGSQSTFGRAGRRTRGSEHVRPGTAFVRPS